MQKQSLKNNKEDKNILLFASAFYGNQYYINKPPFVQKLNEVIAESNLLKKLKVVNQAKYEHISEGLLKYKGASQVLMPLATDSHMMALYANIPNKTITIFDNGALPDNF